VVEALYYKPKGCGIESRWDGFFFFFNLPNPWSGTMDPGFDWTSNRNEYQESSCVVNVGPERKADNLTAISEAIVYKMWESRRLTNLWTFTACYTDRVTFLPLCSVCERVSGVAWTHCCTKGFISLPRILYLPAWNNLRTEWALLS
jgi:hypothetical protein